MLRVYGKSWNALFDATAATTPHPPLQDDPNLRRLAETARRLAWPAVDFLDLREAYLAQMAALGDRPTLTMDDWRQRRTMLESRRLIDTQAGENGDLFPQNE